MERLSLKFFKDIHKLLKKFVPRPFIITVLNICLKNSKNYSKAVHELER